MGIIADIVKGVTGPAVSYLSDRQKLRSAERIRKAELADAHHQRLLEAAKLGQMQTHDWEMEFARQAANSWKDEFELIVVTIPLVGCWIFPAETLAGFKVLSMAPAWFLTLVLTIYLANYGIRKYKKRRPQP